MAIAPLQPGSVLANPPRTPDLLPLSNLALTSWRHGMTPDQLDMIADVFRKTAKELRAIGGAAHA